MSPPPAELLPIKPTKLQSFQKRKALGGVIAMRMALYEERLPKHKRGAWNHKIARSYENAIDENGEIRMNRFSDPIVIPTDEEAKRSCTYNPETIGNQKRWARVGNCCSIIEKKTDKNTGQTLYVKKNQCKDKACPICSHNKSVRMAHKYLPKLQAMNKPVMLVLHERNCAKGTLAETIARMNKDWRNLMKKANEAKRGYSGIVSWEVTTNEKTQTFHPHMHVIVESEHAKQILEDWIKRNPAKRTYHAHLNNGQNMKPMSKDMDSLFEVLKYTMKVSVSTQSKKKGEDKKKKEMASTEMIYEIMCAMHQKPQWQPFGTWRKNNHEPEPIADEKQIDIEENPEVQQCDKWVWCYDTWDWVGTITGTQVTTRLVQSSLPASFYTFTRLKPPS